MRMYPRPKFVTRMPQSGMRRVMGRRKSEIGNRKSETGARSFDYPLPSTDSRLDRNRHLSQNALQELSLASAGAETVRRDREDPVGEHRLGDRLRVVGDRVVPSLDERI